MLYKTVSPDTNKPDGFSSNDLVTVIIPIEEGMSLVRNSIAISGTLSVRKASPAAPLDVADGVQYDAQTGIHGFIENMVTSVDIGQGEMVIENLSQYSQYCHAFFEANQHFLTQALQNSASMELRCGQDTYTSAVLVGTKASAGGANTGDNSFAFKPLSAVNRTSADIPGAQVRFLKIQMSLKNVANVFYNPAPVANLAYLLTDIRCHYGMVPTPDGKMMPIEFTKVICTKTSINSSSAQLRYTPPASVIATSAIFNLVLQSGGVAPPAGHKIWTTDQLPDVTRVEFSVNGADYTLKYPLNSEEEIILNYIKSLNYRASESNAIYPNLLGRGYGIGINYLVPIDFRKSSMGINIQSAIASTGQYNVNLFFTCIDSM